MSALRHLLTSVPSDPTFQILCNGCGAPKPSADFAPSQLKKKRPVCLLCKPSKSKFGNRHSQGRVSVRESKRASLLNAWQNAGAIRDLREQVRYTLIPAQLGPSGERNEKPVYYFADFVYVDVFTGNTIVEDAKGMRTPAYILKRKLMLFVHGIRIQEV